MDVSDAIRRRRMARAYDGRPVDGDALHRVLDAALRAPSAGLSQPVDLLVLSDPADRQVFWDLAFPVQEGYGWPHLFDAPVVVVPLVEPDAYARRYSLPDKAAAGLDDLEAWPVPYWWIDGGAAVENLLLAAVGEGLGASLFMLYLNEAEILRSFGVPEGHRALGGVTIGHPLPEDPVVSSPLPKRRREDCIHHDRW
jgi:nitroreductase